MKRLLACLLALAPACGARSPLEGEELTAPAPGRPAPRNACGGAGPLQGAPGDACGACGALRCEGAEALRCEELAQRNACGVCGPTPREECNGRDDNCDGRVDEGCALRLAPLVTSEVHARVSGSRVVLQAQGMLSNDSDIVLVELPSLRWRYLSPHASTPNGHDDPTQDLDPDLDGDLVAWIERRVDPLGPLGRLRVLDLATGAMLDAGDRSATAPSVSEGRVAFEVNPRAGSDDRDVYLWERSTGAVRPLAADPMLYEASPSLSGEWLVYVRAPLARWVDGRQIVARSLRTGEERTLSEGLAGWHVAPAVDGARVVWRAEQGNSSPSQPGQVWLYELDGGQRRLVSTGTFDERPRVGGDLVCWNATSSASEPGLTVLDLATGRRSVLSREGVGCDVDARRVVFSGNFGGVDAYVRDLLEGEP